MRDVIEPNVLTEDGVLICNHPPKMTLRRTDGSYATYVFPLGTQPADFSLERRVLDRMEDEMRGGAVVVES